MKAMAKKPGERYASMDELLAALRDVHDAGVVSSRSVEISSESSLTSLDSYSGSFTPTGLTSTGATPSASWNGPIAPAAPEPGTARWKIFVAVIALAIVAGVGLALYGRRTPAPTPGGSATAPAETPAGAPAETPVIPPPGETISEAEATQAPAPGTVRIALRSEPSGALVIVGNRSYRTPADVEWGGEDATPGREVTFQFELDGYRDMSVSRVIQEGTMTVTATLEEAERGRVRRPVRRPAMTGGTGGPVVVPRGYHETPY